MTPDLSRQLGRLLSLSAATPAERDVLIRATASPSVVSLEALHPDAIQLVAELRRRVRLKESR